MKIESVHIKNFRCFESIDVGFDERMTLLIGKNGAGKSAVLDAVKIAIGALVSELKIKSPGINKDDVRTVCYPMGSGLDVQPQYPVEIEATGSIDGVETGWCRSLKTQSGRTALANANKFKKTVNQYSKRVAKGDRSLTLPIISYYGTGRVWAQKRAKQTLALTPSTRLNGYLDSLDSAANDKLMLKWFCKMAIRDSQNKACSPEFKAVKKAIASCFQNFTGNKDVDVILDTDEVEINIRYTSAEGNRLQSSLHQLSDGYRCALSLIADIAYRMATLNPQLLDHVLEETSGVVLIDEVDLHLHPAWQHRILEDLLTVFPKVQFIVTTHAPSVIHSIPMGKMIIIEEGGKLRESRLPYGKDANTVLVGTMDASERPARIREMFDAFYGLMDAEDFDGAGAQLNELEKILGGDDTELNACQTSLQLELLS